MIQLFHPKMIDIMKLYSWRKITTNVNWYVKKKHFHAPKKHPCNKFYKGNPKLSRQLSPTTDANCETSKGKLYQLLAPPNS